MVQKRRSMPRGTSSALETLLLVLVCTLCKGTAKLLRKKKQPLLCASDLGARYSGVPTHPTISLPGVNLGNHFESSGTCPNASKKNSLGKFILKFLTWLHGKKDAPGPGRPTGAPQDASRNIGRGTLANPGVIRKIRGTCP